MAGRRPLLSGHEKKTAPRCQHQGFETWSGAVCFSQENRTLDEARDTADDSAFLIGRALVLAGHAARVSRWSSDDDDGV